MALEEGLDKAPTHHRGADLELPLVVDSEEVSDKLTTHPLEDLRVSVVVEEEHPLPLQNFVDEGFFIIIIIVV